MQWSSNPKIQFRIPDHLETNKKKSLSKKTKEISDLLKLDIHKMPDLYMWTRLCKV